MEMLERSSGLSKDEDCLQNPSAENRPAEIPKGEQPGQMDRASGSEGMLLKSNIQDTGIPGEMEGAEKERNNR